MSKNHMPTGLAICVNAKKFVFNDSGRNFFPFVAMFPVALQYAQINQNLFLPCTRLLLIHFYGLVPCGLAVGESESELVLKNSKRQQ
jgi:hypothetical protein